MKRVFVIALLLGANLSYGINAIQQGDQTLTEEVVRSVVSVAVQQRLKDVKKRLERKEFDKQWEIVFGEKPNSEFWVTADICNGDNGGGSTCGNRPCKGCMSGGRD